MLLEFASTHLMLGGPCPCPLTSGTGWGWGNTQSKFSRTRLVYDFIKFRAISTENVLFRLNC